MTETTSSNRRLARLDPAFWRHHFDKVARQRVQTADQLTARRSALIAATADYLIYTSPPRVLSKNAYQEAKTLFRRKWGCDEAWLAALEELREVVEPSPTKLRLAAFLAFPEAEASPAPRHKRKEHRV